MKSKDQILLEEAYKKVSAGNTYKVSTKDKRNISKSLEKYGLDGNGRFGNPSKGISTLSKALDEAGFQLDMVSGDILLGDKNTRLLIYRKVSETTKEFEEHPEVTNSRISYTWELLRTDEDGNPVYEILAYPS